MKILDSVVKALVVVFFIALTAVVSAQVMVRYVLTGSIPWSEEGVRHLFIWLSFLGMILVTEHRAHISVTTVVDLLPPTPKRIAALLSDLMSMAFLLFLVWQGISLVAQTWSMPSPTASTPMGLVYAAVPLSAALMFVFWVRNFLRRLRGTEEESKGPTGAEA